MGFLARIKKLTDYIYSPTNPASEDAIRQQIDGAVQEVYDNTQSALSASDGSELIGYDGGFGPTVKTALALLESGGSGSVPPDNSVTRPKLASDIRALMSNQDKAIATNSAAIDELFVSEGISNKIAPTSGKFYDYVGASGVLSQGSIDFGKVFASSVTQGANTLVATNLQVAKDQTVPTNLSDSFKVGDKVTLADDASKEALIVSNVDDGTKTLTFTTNIVNTYPSGANVYRSNIKTVGEFYEFAGFDEIVTNPDFDTWDETLANPSAAWSHSVAVGTDVYGRPNSGTGAIWKYNTLTNVWDETLAVAPSDWLFPVAIGTDIYVKKSGTGDIMKYDTLTDTWDDTLSAASAEWEFSTAIGTDVYTKKTTSPFNIFKYDTLTDTWDQTLASPSEDVSYLVAIGTDLFCKQDSAFKVFKYDTVGDTWDETLAAPSARWDYPVVVGTDIYAEDLLNTFKFFKYNTLTNTWDETLTAPSAVWDYAVNVDDVLYVIQRAASYKVWTFDPREEIGSETKVLDIDIRMNIQPLESVIDIGAYMDVTNNVLAVDGQVSIVGELDNESYTDLVDTRRAINATNDEIASLLNSTLTANDKVTLEYNLTRSLTTDVVKITSILGGVS